MKITEYRSDFLNILSPLYGTAESESFFYLILEKYKGWKRIDLALNPEAVLDPKETERWNTIVSELLKHKPIQYILGSAHFYGMEFIVNESTLIPRQETEELVQWIIDDHVMLKDLKVIDIGTGSGCIAISLAKNLKNSSVTAVDISAEALKTASENATLNNTTVTFLEQDILSTQSLPGTFDIIVSNPPYVRNLEKTEISRNVLDYEPHSALFVEDKNPLLFYQKIAFLAQKSLNQNGRLYFEINQYLGRETIEMLTDLGFKNFILKKDIYGNDRMISCNT